jgi:uncharacterized protein YodC (DUF2158 family)
MALIQDLYSRLLGQKTKFHEGDYVQSCKGGPLMIVQWIEVNRKNKSVTLNCKWFDSDSKSTRTNLFYEDQLMPFDWNNP